MIQGAARGAMQGVMQAPTTMREALMQQSGPQQSVAEILSEPLGEMTPNLGGATSAASRQRRIADMLLQGAQSQDNTSIAGGLSQLGQAFLAGKAGQKADKAEDKQREMANLLLQQAMGQGPESQAARAQIFADSPAALIAQSDAQRATQAEAAKPQYQEVGDALLRIGPDGVTPVYEAPQAPEPAKFASAADAAGVRRYTEGPNIGQPVPGFETPRSERGGMSVSVDENGFPVVTFGGPGVGSSFGSRGDAVGATAFGTSLEDAGTADNTLALFNTAAGILDRGYNSGFFADIKGKVGAAASDIGIGIPGFSKPENVADYEQFSAINKQLAAQMLKLFGGSDTERELAISITSNIGPGMSEETNKRMIETGRQIIERQRSKPEFIAQWNRRYGSLDAINPETGLGFQATWDRFLQEQMATMTGAASNTRQVAVEGAAQSWTPDKEARRKELEAMLRGGQ
jgi:hypothetical protein